MNKRKVPAEWVESSEKTLGIKQLKSFGSEQLNEGDIDQLLCGIDFDDALETDGSEKCKRVDEKSAVVEVKIIENQCVDDLVYRASDNFRQTAMVTLTYPLGRVVSSRQWSRNQKRTI